ncbi:UDP-N-acetylmuramate dehydrogenase [Synergistaceae bacterium OttesenSCG-928-I11]|nr:UDP-N-acetylmuramate dehydrogenase [Synergistaceae bacterium OttesenSCG-928-I11]
MPLRSLPERFFDFSVSNRPLAPLTTWGIGGVSRFFLAPRNEEELAAVISLLDREGERFHVLGGGSNLLINDGTIETPVLHTALMNAINVVVESGKILLECGAGTNLKQIFRLALDEAWSGLEFLAGIPGTVGGALMGNAGTKHGTIAESVVAVRTVEANGALLDWDANDIEWGYRTSPFPNLGGRVIVKAVFSLRQSEKEQVLERVKMAITERKSQPHGVKTAGCVFKNPQGDTAGRLLDRSGCKGLSVRGAVVSRKHANFFENAGGATADDMVELVRLCGKRVYDAFGVELKLEIKTMGFEEPFPLR